VVVEELVEGGAMSYGVPGIPGVPGPVRSAGKDVDSARLDERTLDEAAHQHEMSEEAKQHEQAGRDFFRRLFRRRSPR
jgi:hypothetical protein